MTIDELAIATQQEFQAVRGEMAQMEERLDRKIDSLETKMTEGFDKIGDKIDKLARHVGKLDTRLFAAASGG